MNPPNREVDARLPLALLRAMQRQDTPPELMPDEHPRSFFPHRLGLSDVVAEQIRRFRRSARLRRRVGEAQVEALLELIARRSDADAVFSAAGRELAGLHFSGPAGIFRRLTKRLPQPLRRRAALRTLRTAHGAYLIAADKHLVKTAPLEIRATDPVTARIGEYGAACKLYGSLAASLLELSGLGQTTVSHTECQRRGDERCVWRVEGDSGGR
ncbi:MAG: hypothetical protein JSV86_12300 [Gemmatimonadota bacterium]|nr:MAG: hypothetical protein JSV86_12300 [Gemmatimonadota bacterium]